MSSTVVFNTKQKGIKEAPEKFHRACVRATGQVMEKARQEARKRAPVRFGRIKGTKGGRGAIDWDVQENGPIITGVLKGTALNPETGKDYFQYIVRGTGKHGPHKTRIKPKRKKVLVWMKDPTMPRPKTPQGWKEARLKKLVWIAKSVEGMKPNDFMQKGLKAGVKSAPAIFNREIEKMNQELS
jgi:hypothetical protein